MNAATLTAADKLHSASPARSAGTAPVPPADGQPDRPPNDNTKVGATAKALASLDDPLECARFTRWRVGPGGQRLGESALQLSGMHCAACAGLIEAALLAVPGVHEARVAAAAQRATVVWDPTLAQPSGLVAAVQAAGYGAAPDAAAPARALRRSEARLALWRLFVAAFCAMQVMMLATPGYVSGPGELSADMRRVLDWGGWVLSLPVLAFSCGPFFAGAWRSLRARRIGMDVPVSLGIVITFVASSGAAFQPGGVFGSEVYFDSLTMFVSLLLGARYLEMRMRHQAADELEAGLARMPETALRLRQDGHTESVSVLRLVPGDHVLVPLGQAFPADGTLHEGTTQCDESLLTGEAMPVPKAVGDELVAGSLNVGAPAVLQVLRVGADTRYEGIVAMMRSAATQRPALARLADHYAAPFLWAVLLLAAAGAAAWSFIDPSRALWVAVAVLIVTCPCALSLAAPATLLAATRALARRGVVVQRLDAIEALAGAHKVFFDKTGTLTDELPTLVQVRPCGPAAVGVQPEAMQGEALRCAAQLAAASHHPLSRALVAAAASWPGAVKATPAEPGFTEVQEWPGLGVQAIDRLGHRWRLGEARWVQQKGPEDAAPGQGTEAHVMLGCDGEPIAAFEFEESVRPGAGEAVAALRSAGIGVALLSGDRHARAQALASRLGIEEVLAEARPEDKLAAVAAAQAAGQRVVMVGDGINDAPVLARADVALAMGPGALVARAHADAVLASGRPADIVEARAIAQRAVRIVHQNLAWAVGYNALSVPLALAGWLPPWAAGLGMALSSLWVVANAQRAAR